MHCERFIRRGYWRSRIEPDSPNGRDLGHAGGQSRLMLQAMIGSAKGKPNQIVYWSRLPDWKNQTLTPNPDVI
jgi:hypothetical protein